MNERIRELAIASDLVSDDGNRLVSPWMEHVDLSDPVDKFVELIVQECVNACYNHADVEAFGICPARVAIVTQACADNIKAHFGIE